MNNEKQNINKISEEIINFAAAKAALNVSGVNRLSDTFADNLSRMIGTKDNNFTGIKISREKEQLCLDVFVIVEYGCKIPQLAWDIQNAVKEAVENVTDSKVKEVNIHIQGVMMPREVRK